MTHLLASLVLITGLLLPAQGWTAQMWAHVQSKPGTVGTTSGTTMAVTFDSGVTPGSIIICGIGWYGAGGTTLSGVADSLAQTHTQIGTTQCSTTTGGDWCAAMTRFYNSAGGANTVTATLSAATSAFRGISCSEYSGIATSNALDQTAQQAQTDVGTGTDAMTSGATASTSEADELVVSVAISPPSDLGANSVVAGTNFTRRTESSDGTWMRLVTGDRHLATATTVVGTWTCSNVGCSALDPAIIVATFKQVSAGPAINFYGKRQQ